MRNTLLLTTLLMTGLCIGTCSKKVAVAPENVKEKSTIPVQSPVIEIKAPETVAKNKIVQSAETPIYQFRDIHFDFDRYELKPETIEILSEHARQLKKNQNIKILIEGHCDEWGTIEYNLALGERRSNSVKNFLVKYGISPNRLSTISYGKERPLVAEHNASAWAKNRRAALVTGS
ncbi:MAG: peptidoglycan-associated lipoprotein Pal [Candidatus Marinimicrobia bacterium]|nr:peptidoglycan-associated lipoprotein Pal [bacterium]MCG2716549.1 peptidoglycan-associated lipoprotein Pal [Candidatus Neomarinimicrobiota bacterium]